MGLLSWFRSRDRKSAVTTLDLLRELDGGLESSTGQPITWQTALQVTTVLRCCSVIADGVATVPLRIFLKDRGTGQRRPAMDHPLYDLLAVQPNDWQDSLQFREMLAFHLALTGNAYVFVNRVAGRVAELIPLEPARVSVKQEKDWRLTYKVTNTEGQQQEFPAEAIWHIRGPSWSGWEGLKAIKLARDAIGLSSALEASHARLHKNGVKPSGMYSVEGTLNKEQYDQLRSWLKKSFAGMANSGEPMIMDRAAKWMSLAMTGVDAQHIETRKHQIEEICRAFGVMPIMVGYSDKAATYASAEQMFLAHNVHTTRPWHRRFEMSIKRQLMTEEDRAAGYYPKFIDTELLRGAAKDRAEYYAKGINAGWLLRNEAREWEELDPVDGLSEPLTPANMVIGDEPTEPTPPN